MSERRLRVLVSAYACGPSDESEANAGWAYAAAAAVEHDVWLVTRPRFAESIEAAVAADPVLREHLTVVYHDLSERTFARRRRASDVYWYYYLWQRRLGDLARRLHAEIGFDVAHHVTFAVDWQVCGLLGLPGVPLVWGPVGGATYAPLRLLRWFGARAAVGELLRGAATRLARRVWGDPVARRAAVVVAQNDDVAARFSAARRVVVETNSAFEAVPASGVARSGRRAIFVGRLVGWKGVRIMVAVMADPRVSDWRLDVYGSGPERPELERRATRLGVADRITFHGQRPRAEILRAYTEADAMLFPSLHDSAPWAVGEASSAGCRVVCVAAGGPPLLAGDNGIAVAADAHVVANLATGLLRAGAEPGTPTNRWSARRLPALLRDWYADAAGNT